MNIKDFLIDNYIWILVIILITIVTIIGFIADTKKNNKKNKNPEQPAPNINNQPINNVGVMQYQEPTQLQQNQMNNQMNNNLAMNTNNMNAPMENLNQLNNTVSTPQQNVTMPQPQPVEPVNNPQPVENIVVNPTTEPMYQPLSEQKPVISPQPVPNFNGAPLPNVTQPEPAPIQPMMNNQLPINNAPNIDLSQQQVMTQQVGMEPQPIPNMTGIPATNITQPEPSPVQPMMNGTQPMNNSIITPSVMPNNATIPQPVNPVPIPQPVNPQPIMQEQYNQVQAMQTPNYTMPQPMPTMAQPIQESQPVGGLQPEQNSQMAPQSVNFVFGPQSNNQNM